MVIDGKKIADSILTRLKENPIPQRFLAGILVGNDPATGSFIRQKELVAKELKVDFRIKKLEVSIEEGALIKTLNELGKDRDCGGIILQLPLPAHIDRAQVIATIPPGKDVDNLRGEGPLTAPAVGVVEEIFKATSYQLPGAVVAVVGMGFLVGRPIAEWLKGRAKEVITLDIGDDLAHIKDADIVILGVGKAGFVRAAQLKNDTLVVDFGYSRGNDGALRGDFDPQGTEQISYTPTPGGTGPILVAKLFENFYNLR